MRSMRLEDIVDRAWHNYQRSLDTRLWWWTRTYYRLKWRWSA